MITEDHIGVLPKCLDMTAIKVPAFTCILDHLKQSLSHCKKFIERRRTLAEMTLEAKGKPATTGAPPTTGNHGITE